MITTSGERDQRRRAQARAGAAPAALPLHLHRLVRALRLIFSTFNAMFNAMLNAAGRSQSGGERGCGSARLSAAVQPGSAAGEQADEL